MSDNGRPRSRKTTAKVRIEVIDRPRHSSNRPRFDVGYMEKRVMEDDKVGHMVELLGAYDADNDNLFYSIIGKNLVVFVWGKHHVNSFSVIIGQSA